MEGKYCTIFISGSQALSVEGNGAINVTQHSLTEKKPGIKEKFLPFIPVF